MSDAPASQPSPPPQDGWVTLGNGETFELASRVNIGLATFIDSALLFPPLMLILTISMLFSLDRTGRGLSLSAGMILILLTAGSFILYPSVMITSKGQTLGMKYARIKIVSAEDGSYPNWEQLFRAYKEFMAHRLRTFSLPYNVRLHEHTKFLNECDVKIIKV